jgi:hypothetical protein
MQADPIISEHIGKYTGTTTSNKLLHSSDYLIYILNEIVDKYILLHNKEFDESLFDNMYHDLEVFFYSDEIPVTCTAPLYKFDSDVDYIDISDGISIRKIKEDESSLNTNLPYLIYTW